VTNYLTCYNCAFIEPITDETAFVGCPICGRERYAVNEEGNAVYCLSQQDDPTDWASPAHNKGETE